MFADHDVKPGQLRAGARPGRSTAAICKAAGQAGWDQGPSRTVLVVIVLALLTRDVCVDGVSDELVGAAGFVLVDHRGSLAVVSPGAGIHSHCRPLLAGLSRVTTGTNYEPVSITSGCSHHNLVLPQPGLYSFACRPELALRLRRQRGPDLG